MNNEIQLELELRKFKLVRFLYNIIIIPFIFAFIVNVANIIVRVSTSQEIPMDRLMLVSITTFLTICIIAIRLSLKENRYKQAFSFLTLVIMLFSFYGILTTGTSVLLPYVFLIIMFLSSAIIFGIKTSTRIIVVSSVLLLIILALHNFNIVKYTPELSTSKIDNTLILIIFIFIIRNIIILGYSEIEHSYSKATLYLSQLQTLNKSLERKVKARTQKLKENFEREAESVHSAAIIGSITQPLLHDLATPISALKGSVYLLENSNPSEISSLVSHSKLALEQLESLLNNARDLMQGKKQETDFNPKHVILNILHVVKDRLHKGSIELEVELSESVRIYGISVMFSRIIANIIQNAIEELLEADEEKPRHLKIYDKFIKNTYKIIIEDNGRGIDEKNITSIFKPNFTTKTSSNLGFGLPFVKKSIQKYFNGSVEVKSEVNKYTQFILTLHPSNKLGPKVSNELEPNQYNPE